MSIDQISEKQIKEYIDGILSGDRRILAKSITLIESTLKAHQEAARKILDRILPFTGKAVRLGITGLPGAGKSTFIESFGKMLTARGHRVAVLAVDPSSPRTGGSIMADKTRMEKLAVDPNAFIRPSASGGTLGGVARKTRETMLICEAAGFDWIIVETVGVGQSEVTVATMVDFFLVLMIAGAGDELQGIKKGVLELADALAINKADGDNIERAKAARQQYEIAFHLINPPTRIWTPPVLTCSALTMEGLDRILDVILTHRRKMTEHGELERKRKAQNLEWFWSLVREGLELWFFQDEEVKKNLMSLIKDIEEGTVSPTSAAEHILSRLRHISS
ncbi:MAG: methylmalonyl Co-A mutase-associated GTPase MeaB [Syntrophales bacterium]|nr:methylmalonyl Co-A mutase-associated GTPase MeaB [Syntrophales bacterium]